MSPPVSGFFRFPLTLRRQPSGPAQEPEALRRRPAQKILQELSRVAVKGYAPPAGGRLFHPLRRRKRYQPVGRGLELGELHIVAVKMLALQVLQLVAQALGAFFPAKSASLRIS